MSYYMTQGTLRHSIANYSGLRSTLHIRAKGFVDDSCVPVGCDDGGDSGIEVPVPREPNLPLN